MIIKEIYNTLASSYDGKNFLNSAKSLEKFYPKLSNGFYGFLELYCANIDIEKLKLRNNVLFEEETIDNFYQAILYYIAGMTDHFAMEMYQEIIGF